MLIARGTACLDLADRATADAELAAPDPPHRSARTITGSTARATAA